MLQREAEEKTHGIGTQYSIVTPDRCSDTSTSVSAPLSYGIAAGISVDNTVRRVERFATCSHHCARVVILEKEKEKIWVWARHENYIRGHVFNNN